MVTALIGILIGLAVGLTGVGGGTLTVPALIIVLGMPAAEAVGTALLYVTITKVFAVPVYWMRGQVELSVLKRLLMGGLPGVIGGAWLLEGMNTERLTPVILAVVGLTIVSLASVSLWKLVWDAAGGGVPAAVSELAGVADRGRGGILVGGRGGVGQLTAAELCDDRAGGDYRDRLTLRLDPIGGGWVISLVGWHLQRTGIDAIGAGGGDGGVGGSGVGDKVTGAAIAGYVERDVGDCGF